VPPQYPQDSCHESLSVFIGSITEEIGTLKRCKYYSCCFSVCDCAGARRGG